MTSQVVYGDTDSLFIVLKGKSKDEAFLIGDEITEAVTNMNPVFFVTTSLKFSLRALPIYFAYLSIMTYYDVASPSSLPSLL